MSKMSNSCRLSGRPPRLRSTREQAHFEARRLHNLLGLAEGARNPKEYAQASASVLRALRRYLTDFHGLPGRADAAETMRSNWEGIL